METFTVNASEVYDEVIWRIFEVRHRAEMAEYERGLRQYKRQLRGREEKMFNVSEKHSGVALSTQEHRGFQRKAKSMREAAEHGSQTVTILRPEKPKPPAVWYYEENERSSYWGTTHAAHAANKGLLADSLYNREIRPRKVYEFSEIMSRGEWHDLLSDPISITEDGQVINAQHRLAAVNRVNWEDASNDPLFLVVWGVDSAEALHADLSKRTAREQATIAQKVVDAA